MHADGGERAEGAERPAAEAPKAAPSAAVAPMPDPGGAEGAAAAGSEHAPPAGAAPGPAPADAGTAGGHGAAVPAAVRLGEMGAALAQAAAAVLADLEEEAVAGAAPAAPVAEGPPLSFAEACATLGVSPYVLRRLMDDYEDDLPPLVEAGAERRLPSAALEALAQILRWRGDGLSTPEIVKRLGAQRAAAERPPQGAAAAGVTGSEASRDGPGVDRLLTEVSRLHDELLRSEQRRTEDRDRLLTALMRTNQELQHLRYEMAARSSRKERRKGLWARIFR